MKNKISLKIIQMGLPLLAALLVLAAWLFFMPGPAAAQIIAAPVIDEFFANPTETSIAEFGQNYYLSPDDVAANLLQSSNVISITKSAPAQVLPGSLYTYTISVVNSFAYTLTDVMIGDLLPVGTSFVSVLDGGVYSTAPFPIVSWSLGDLAPLASVDVRFVVTAPNFQTIVVNNVYGVWATNSNSYFLGTPVYTEVGTFSQVPTEIPITKFAPAQVLPGSLYTYTISVVNPFTYTLTGVMIGDLIPVGTSFVSVLDGGVYSTNPFPIVSWSPGDLAPSASVDVRFVVTAPTTETIVVNNVYQVSATNFRAHSLSAPSYTVVGDHILIRQIQGSGSASPFVNGDVFGVQGIVTRMLYNNSASTDAVGFFMQDPNPDANPLTSEGIYVYAPVEVDRLQIGEAITVSGTVKEYFGLTEISSVTSAITGTATATIAPTSVSLPVTSMNAFEAYEGMLVTFPQPLVIAEYFNFDRFGEIVLSGVRHQTPTAFVEPGTDAIQEAQEYLLDRITLDDGRTNQNPDPAIHPNGGVFDLTNLFRGGDSVANVSGVVDYSFGLYRIQPTQGADYINANVRPAQPDVVGGSLKVASFNVLNYFTTLDNSGPICGPLQNQECRGADDATEFTRQRDKIIAAISAIDADVVGLIEIENHPADVPTADLVSGLNAALGAGTYDYIVTGAIGTDAIRQAFIYKPASVSPVGAFAVLDTSVDPRFLDDYNRPVLAQTFQQNGTNELVTVAVNHLKSKGSDCNAIGDPDLGDGAGNCNLTRLAAAEALLDWLASDPTASGDPDFLIIGDLNSYDKEDPIDALLAGGYSDLIYDFIGEDAYSYVFDGQTGYLDYALADANLLPQVTGVTIWHINADEADLIDYDTSFKQDAQDAIYAPDAYRSSDHDPVVVGIDLGSPAISLAKLVSPYMEVSLGGSVTYTITLQNNGTYAANGVMLTDTLPAAVNFGGWLQQSGAAVANDEITWMGNLDAGSAITLVFTTSVVNDLAFNGQTVINSAVYRYGAQRGSADASFVIRYLNYLYLPVTTRDFGVP